MKDKEQLLQEKSDLEKRLDDINLFLRLYEEIDDLQKENKELHKELDQYKQTGTLFRGDVLDVYKKVQNDNPYEYDNVWWKA